MSGDDEGRGPEDGAEETREVHASIHHENLGRPREEFKPTEIACI